MYKNIMVPVDLSHTEQVEKAISTAATLGRLYGSKLSIVGVTSTAPGAAGHNPPEHAERLNAFCAEQSTKHGTPFHSVPLISHDPGTDLDDRLKEAAEELGADLVVMASHVPGFLDHFFSSRAGYLASHVAISVFIVR